MLPRYQFRMTVKRALIAGYDCSRLCYLSTVTVVRTLTAPSNNSYALRYLRVKTRARRMPINISIVKNERYLWTKRGMFRPNLGILFKPLVTIVDPHRYLHFEPRCGVNFHGTAGGH